MPRTERDEQAHRVFLAGNGLPGRWRGRERFIVLETGFGLGHSFLATWDAWRRDPQRCDRLDFVSIEPHAPSLDALRRAHAASLTPVLAAELLAAWPPLTPNFHLRSFEAGRVRLLLALGGARDSLSELVLQADAFYLGAPDPGTPVTRPWRDFAKAIARLAAPAATVATANTSNELRGGLGAAGFDVSGVGSIAGEGAMTVARFAPRHVAQRPAGRPDRSTGPVPGSPRDVLVIGAGLAGAAAAHSLAEQGFGCQVLEAAHGVAQGSSGNPGGLFHGTLHADDGLHARWHRAAALMAAHLVVPHVHSGALPGQARGLLRLEAARSHADMVELLHGLGLPASYVQALDAAQASTRAGLTLSFPAWLYPAGAWVDPAAWVALQLRHPHIELRCGAAVQRVQAVAGRWRALDGEGRCLAEASQVVIANGTGIARMAELTGLTNVTGPNGLTLERVRGQITRLPATLLAGTPSLPISGDGYALTLPGGDVLCGATAHPGDDGAELRTADTLYNLARLERITGAFRQPIDASLLRGRVGWRMTARDRLPLVGALPSNIQAQRRLDTPRFLAREPGLHVLGALGSRGIASAALGGEVLAAWISGAPLPIESSLLDAVDPARGLARQARRAARPG